MSDEEESSSVESTHNLSIPVYTPTMEEFADFNRFVAKIEPVCSKIGLCKVIPPKEWKPSKKSYDEWMKQLVVHSPIWQYATGGRGVYEFSNEVDVRPFFLPHFVIEI